MAYKINYTGSSKVIKRLCEAVNDLIDHGGGGGGGISTSSASASSLPAGSSATVSTSITGSNIDFQFGIPRGDKGDKGDPGEGVPTGGSTGQVLAKRSGTDYDVYWKNESGGGGGSTVVITPTLSTGIKIADFEIDGNTGELYAPSGGGSGVSPLYYDSEGSICIDYDLLEVR